MAIIVAQDHCSISLDLMYMRYIHLQADGSYLVTFPDFPEINFTSESHAIAQEKAKEMLQEAFYWRVKNKEEIPLNWELT